MNHVNREMPHRESEILVLGTASELTSSGVFSGNISASQRRATTEPSQNIIQEALLEVDDFYFRTSQGAQVRCIDGRPPTPLETSVPNSSEQKEMGPQTPGGSLAQAIGYRLTIGNLTKRSFSDDIEKVVSATNKAGYKIGGHSDETNFSTSSNKTGCGAIDTIEEQLAYLYQPSTSKCVEELTKALLGAEYNPQDFVHITNSAMRMHQSTQDYLHDKKSLFHELTNSNPGAISILTGPHREIITAINTVEGTTFDSAQFFSSHHDEIQAFNYDLWYSRTISQLMFKDDHQLQSRYLHVQVALAVATLMALTDGTLTTISRVRA